MSKVNLSLIPFYFLLVFSLFIVYGTTIPFNFGGEENFYKRVQEICWIPFMAREGGRTSFSDVIQNIFLFIPVGILGWLSLHRYTNKILSFLKVFFFGVLLSFSVECLQLITVDRTTSVTDIITNGFGTVVGIILCSIIVKFWLKIHKHHLIAQVIQYPLFIPFVLLVFLINAELLQPFDFALDLGSGLQKIKHIINDPLKLYLSGRDDPFVILTFATLTFLILKGINQVQIKIPVWMCICALLIYNITLESIQFVIRSRSPEITDILIGVAGIITGFLAYVLSKLVVLKPRIFLMAGFMFSYFCKTYHPFKISESYRKFNWIPFFTEYSQTTMISLGNTIETFIFFSFGGYVFNSLYKNTFSKVYVLFPVLLFISISEILQGWITGRYPDITDILVGFAAFIFSRFALQHAQGRL